ncbi:MAG: hypothetical protein IPM51_00655 [Sphingobacteriaceae bacterium]|nr:hypothetical protein [Sphingobacteriaceae bacterium]
MKKIIFQTILAFAPFLLFSQENISSPTFIQTCIKNHQCYSISNSSYLFYDETKSSFYLKVDFSKFEIGIDSIDDWLKDLEETSLLFKAPMDPSHFSGLANHNHKTIKLNGQVFLNGIWHNQSVELNLYMTENGLLNQNNNQNNFDLYKVNFILNILPKEFNIHKKPHHLKKSIVIGVTLGRINQLKPGMIPFLGEAYNH